VPADLEDPILASFRLLLIHAKDIMYRAAVRKEAAWDLFALLGASGAISMVYMARHKVLRQVFGWKRAIIALVAAVVVAAITAVILTLTKAM